MWDAATLAIVAAVFLFAGFVKGVVGLGLPTIALGLLTATLGLMDAIALMLVPAFMTNVVQALVGGHLAALLKRLWRLLATLCLGVWLGTVLLAGADKQAMSGLLGILIFLYAAVSLATPPIPAPGRHERWLSSAYGIVAGIATGLTGAYTMGVPYLEALRLGRDELVQAMGLFFLVSTVALALSLTGNALLPTSLGLLSLLALIPAFLGMAGGQWTRRRVPEAQFRRLINGFLLLLGAYIAARAFL